MSAPATSRVSATLRPPGVRTPADALDRFMREEGREKVILELRPKWWRLGDSEVEEAVDHALDVASAQMVETDAAKVYSYIRTVAYHRLVNVGELADTRYRVAGVDDQALELLAGTTLSAEEVVLLKEHRQILLDALASLEHEDRVLLKTRYLDGATRDEAIRRLGKNGERQFKRHQQKACARFAAHYSAAFAGDNCDGRREAIAALVCGVADPLQREQAERHVEHCASCAEFARTVGAARRAAAAIMPLPLVAQVDGGLLERLAGVGRELVVQLRLLPARATGQSADTAAQLALGTRAGVGAAGAGAAKLLGICISGVALTAGGIYCAQNGLPGLRSGDPPPVKRQAEARPIGAVPTAPMTSPAAELAAQKRAAATARATIARRERRAEQLRDRRAAARKRRAAAIAPTGDPQDEFFSPAATPDQPVPPAPGPASEPSSASADEFPIF